MPKTLIYDPRHSPLYPRTNLSIPIEAVSSPIRFPRVINRPPNKKTAVLDSVETKGNWIRVGTNLGFPDDDFENISKHPTGLELLQSGAIKVIEPSIPEGKIATETTADYSEKDAHDLIANSFDIDWLERSLKKDDRPVTNKKIQDRIKGLMTTNARV